MTDFCVDVLSPEKALRPRHGVLRVAALAVTSDAGDAADLIFRNAQVQADELLDQARDEARQAVRLAEQETIEHAARLLQALKNSQAIFLNRSHDMVIEIAQGLFDRLVLDMTPRKRLEAALKRVLREAPPRLVTPLLRVHPDDLAVLPTVEWEVIGDATLQRGMCRLEATNGQWCVDFNAGVAALKAGLESALRDRDT